MKLLDMLPPSSKDHTCHKIQVHDNFTDMKLCIKSTKVEQNSPHSMKKRQGHLQRTPKFRTEFTHLSTKIMWDSESEFNGNANMVRLTNKIHNLESNVNYREPIYLVLLLDLITKARDSHINFISKRRYFRYHTT